MNHSRRRFATIGAIALSAALARNACAAPGDGDGDGGDGGDELTQVKLQLQ